MSHRRVDYVRPPVATLHPDPPPPLSIAPFTLTQHSRLAGYTAPLPPLLIYLHYRCRTLYPPARPPQPLAHPGIGLTLLSKQRRREKKRRSITIEEKRQEEKEKRKVEKEGAIAWTSDYLSLACVRKVSVAVNWIK